MQIYILIGQSNFGKTTYAINLSNYLAKKYKVLLIFSDKYKKNEPKKFIINCDYLINSIDEISYNYCLNYDYVIIDTAGVFHTKEQLIKFQNYVLTKFQNSSFIAVYNNDYIMKDYIYFNDKVKYVKITHMEKGINKLTYKLINKYNLTILNEMELF
jgi:cellulose biosynthesis protein BcsQ